MTALLAGSCAGVCGANQCPASWHALPRRPIITQSSNVQLKASNCHSFAGSSLSGARQQHTRREKLECSTVCMANQRRVARVSKEIERNIGNLFLYDKRVQKAICPEKRVGLDSAVSAIASVTEVRVSSDLQVAKVYISIFSDDRGREIAMRQLTKLQGYARMYIGKEMSLRLTPEIRFVYDESIERGERVDKLLQRIKLQEAGEMEPPPISLPDWVDEDAEDGGFDADALEDAARAGPLTDEELAGFFDDDSDEDSDDEGLFSDEDEVEEAEISTPSAERPAAPNAARSSAAMAAPVRFEETPVIDGGFFGFEDPGGAVDYDAQRRHGGEESDEEEATLEELMLLPGEVAEGLPMVAATADPWEQPRVLPSERRMSKKKQMKRRARAASGKGR